MLYSLLAMSIKITSIINLRSYKRMKYIYTYFRLRGYININVNIDAN